MKCVCSAILVAIIVLFPLPISVSAKEVSSDIPDGIYYIGTKNGNQLDIEGASTSNGARVIVWRAGNKDNQAFAFMRLPDGTYRISAYHSGLSLEVSNSSKKNGGRVQQWEFLEDYDCKYWYIYDCGNGWYKIINKNSGKCLDISAGKDEAGTAIQQYEDNGTNAQRFSLTKLEYSPQNYNRYKVGDEVYVSGTYYASSNGSGNLGCIPQKYIIELTAYGSKYPYAIRPVNGTSIYGWINESSIEIPDYTKEILSEILPEFQYLKAAFDYSDGISAILEFYNAFKTGGTLDIKREDCWNNLFSVPYPGKTHFTFLEMTVTVDQLGNIIYGWFGTQLGINDVMLYWGGGFAHQKGITGESLSKVVTFDCLYDPLNYYGDTAEDHFDIQRGILLAGYQKDYIVKMDVNQEGKIIQTIGSVIVTTKRIKNKLLDALSFLSI